MSVESLILGKAINGESNNQLLTSIERLERAILSQTIRQTQPFIFLKSNDNILSSNVADAVQILVGPAMPRGTKGVIEDFNVNFTTTAGTVRLVILDANRNIVTDVLRNVNSSTNGTGKTVLDEGNRLAVIGQTAGAGTFSVYCSGFTQIIREVQ